MPRKSDDTRRAKTALRDFAMGFPETHEDFPWGERAIKVGKKAFVFMSSDEQPGLSLSTKLPESAGAATMFPFAQPTHYGLGKSGWVTATFEPGQSPPVEMLRDWIEESYRAVAPKKLVTRRADDRAASKPAKKPPSTKRR